jgi:hypothetical protein
MEYILFQWVFSQWQEMAPRGIFLIFWFQTPLHYAAWEGKGDVVEILVQNGANINEKDVKNISIRETDDFERKRESAEIEREEMRVVTEKDQREEALSLALSL